MGAARGALAAAAAALSLATALPCPGAQSWTIVRQYDEPSNTYRDITFTLQDWGELSANATTITTGLWLIGPLGQPMYWENTFTLRADSADWARVGDTDAQWSTFTPDPYGAFQDAGEFRGQVAFRPDTPQGHGTSLLLGFGESLKLVTTASLNGRVVNTLIEPQRQAFGLTAPLVPEPGTLAAMVALSTAAAAMRRRRR